MNESPPRAGTYDLLLKSADYPSWDGPPRRTLIICTQQRSGSTLLAEAIYFAGEMGSPHEYLSVGFRPFLETRWRSPDLQGYIASLHRFRTDPSGVFAIKLYWSDIFEFVRERKPGEFEGFAGAPAWRTADDTYRRILKILSETLPNPTFVYLTRRNKIRQAISLAVAGQTNLWRQYADTNTDAAGFQAAYRFDEIVQFLAAIQNSDALWLNFFRANALPYLEIAYEDLAEDYIGTLRNLFDHLGRGDAPIPTPRLRKHTEAYAQQWLGRFTEEFRARTRGEKARG
jgi:LPS sulfotransferase NodH